MEQELNLPYDRVLSEAVWRRVAPELTPKARARGRATAQTVSPAIMSFNSFSVLYPVNSARRFRKNDETMKHSSQISLTIPSKGSPGKARRGECKKTVKRAERATVLQLVSVQKILSVRNSSNRVGCRHRKNRPCGYAAGPATRK